MGFRLFGQKSKEEKFWDWFTKHEAQYYHEVNEEESREELFTSLTNELKKVSSEITFEFSPIQNDGIRVMCISAEGVKEFFPIVQNLMSKSPEINNWRFHAFRQRVPGDNYSIQIGDLSISYSDIYFRYGHEENKVNIELNIKDFDNANKTKNAIYILLDGLLGEYDVATMIGWIDWVELEPEKVDSLFPLIELRQIIDDKKRLINN